MDGGETATASAGQAELDSARREEGVARFFLFSTTYLLSFFLILLV